MPKRAILLVNLGSPDSPSVPDVRRYLREFLTDERVIDRPRAAADHALYDAKKAGRNGFATYDPAPPLVPEPGTRGLADMDLRKRA